LSALDFLKLRVVEERLEAALPANTAHNMASQANSLTARLAKLSIGITRTNARFYSSKKKRKERIEPSWLPGHGEKIWIFNHILDGMTVYSHAPVLKVRFFKGF
jgi:hypothetical protein